MRRWKIAFANGGGSLDLYAAYMRLEGVVLTLSDEHGVIIQCPLYNILWWQELPTQDQGDKNNG